MIGMAPHQLLTIFMASALLSGSNGSILDSDSLIDANQSSIEDDDGFEYGSSRQIKCVAPTGPITGGPAPICLVRAECLAQGGQPGAACGRGFARGVCCNFQNVIQCGDRTASTNSIFRNPNFPDPTTDAINCAVDVVPRQDVCGIRIEFLDALLAPSRSGVCFQDLFTVVGGGTVDATGFNTNMCGLLKGYSTMIPVNQTSDLIRLVIMSQSKGVMWNINVTQVNCADLNVPVNDECGVRNNPVLPARSLDFSDLNETAPLAKIVDFEGKILGGADLGGIQFPWMVAVLLDGSHVCSGTLVARQWVVTAASCVNFYAESTAAVGRITLLLGSFNLALAETRRVTRTVERVYIHNEFQGNNFDVAILRMNQTVPFSAAIRPVCFPSPTRNFAGLTGIIAGWGTNGGPAKSNFLLGGNVPVRSNAACQTAWNAMNVVIRDSMICAGDGAVAQCNGDVGGPLIVADANGLFSMVGISSLFAPPACGNPDFPDVYMRTSSFLSWINLVLGQK
ncbi:transmembrane protease serine 9-like [Neocloeon triangulifer]|uniref:transmembrane protease serine 9-like n=1 Tax=Neocloeon triangulifer TaxID=2078957 RepID=UPI00286EE640|nr:transmembrane protease serine 9-like [Neocloeon triangulifer]